MHTEYRVLLKTYFIFFFQAEDGIRDRNVTGVQTCALPIFHAAHAAASPRSCAAACAAWTSSGRSRPAAEPTRPRRRSFRSEERRVGKECRSRSSREL